MLRGLRVALFIVGAVAVGLSPLAVQADAIAVGDASFETPDVSVSLAAVFPVLTPGTRSYDAWGTESSNAGVVLNGQYDRAYTNLDGAQCGWMDVLTQGAVVYQDLTTATYQVGKAYTMTIGLGRLAYGDMDHTLNVALFAREGQTNTNYVAGSVTVRYGDLSATKMTDCIISVPTVQSTDAWAGKPISIWLVNQGGAGAGGCWNYDDVRLASIPEPATLYLLAMAFCGLSAYAWRRRK